MQSRKNYLMMVEENTKEVEKKIEEQGNLYQLGRVCLHVCMCVSVCVILCICLCVCVHVHACVFV